MDPNLREAMQSQTRNTKALWCRKVPSSLWKLTLEQPDLHLNNHCSTILSKNIKNQN